LQKATNINTRRENTTTKRNTITSIVHIKIKKVKKRMKRKKIDNYKKHIFM